MRLVEPLLPERGTVPRAVVEHHRERLLDRIARRLPSPPPAPPPSVPRHRLLRLLGAGSAADVWEAEGPDGERVALKLFHAKHGSPQTLASSQRRELRASLRLDHPGIVRVLDHGQTDEGRAFDLGRLITREGRLPWARVRTLLLQLCEAMAFAHRHGVLHRDLKPANIMVGPGRDGTERCTVVDLGLSRLLDGSVVSRTDGTLVGTPAYMSPEQIRGGEVDHRADVYALGCIAYEMLAGERPFQGQTPGECAVQHLVAPLPRLRLPGSRSQRRAIDAVLRRALTKDPRRRFADVLELAQALRAVDAPRSRWRRPPALALGAMLAGAGLLATAELLGSASVPAELEATTIAAAPAVARDADHIVDVSLGLVHTCAAARDGRAICWGSDTLGRLGRGTENQTLGDNELPADVAPLQLEGVHRIVTAPNARHSCALHQNGTLRCWGHGLHGALGRASTDDFGDDAEEHPGSLPALPLGEVVDVVLSTARTCAIVREGERRNLYCWGRAEHGALGSGSTEDVGDDESLAGLQPVPLGADVLEAAAGNEHTCARLATGSVRCWGSDAYGQLGLPGWTANVGDGVGDGAGSGERPDDPELDVQGLTDVEIVAIDAAGYITCVLTGVGGVRCWGANRGGPLGYPPGELPGCSSHADPGACVLEGPLPFDVDLGGARAVEITTGQRHVCVLDDQAQVRCWGEADGGRLGDGIEADVGLWQSPARAWFGRDTGGVVDVGDADGDGAIDPVAQVDAGITHTCARMVAGGLRCWGMGANGRLGYGSADNVGITTTPADEYVWRGVYDVPVFGR